MPMRVNPTGGMDWDGASSFKMHYDHVSISVYCSLGILNYVDPNCQITSVWLSPWKLCVARCSNLDAAIQYLQKAVPSASAVKIKDRNLTDRSRISMHHTHNFCLVRSAINHWLIQKFFEGPLKSFLRRRRMGELLHSKHFFTLPCIAAYISTDHFLHVPNQSIHWIPGWALMSTWVALGSTRFGALATPRGISLFDPPFLPVIPSLLLAEIAPFDCLTMYGVQDVKLFVAFDIGIHTSAHLQNYICMYTTSKWICRSWSQPLICVDSSSRQWLSMCWSEAVRPVVVLLSRTRSNSYLGKQRIVRGHHWAWLTNFFMVNKLINGSYFLLSRLMIAHKLIFDGPWAEIIVNDGHKLGNDVQWAAKIPHREPAYST